MAGDDDPEWSNMHCTRRHCALAVAAIPREGHVGDNGRRQVPALPPFAVLTVGGKKEVEYSPLPKLHTLRSMELAVHVGDYRGWSDRVLPRLNAWDEDEDWDYEEHATTSVRPDLDWVGARTCGWQRSDIRLKRAQLGCCSIRGCVLISGGEGKVEVDGDEDESEKHEAELETYESEEDDEGLCSADDEARAKLRAERRAARTAVALLDARERRWYRLPPLPEPRVGHAMVVPMERAFWL